MKVVDAIQHTCQLHGAVLLPSPAVIPAHHKVGPWEQEHSAVFLDPSGILVQLPYSLTVPFARSVAQNPKAVGSALKR